MSAPDYVTHDPGGKVRLRLPIGVMGGAKFAGNADEYRLSLSRFIELGPYALWIGMNPSTAMANVDDPTIFREWGFTRALGLGCYIKTNVMDYRATKPEDLLGELVTPRSAGNLDEIMLHARGASRIILAFGAIHKKLRDYAVETVEILEAAGFDLWCLGFTKDGSPRHPLYIKGGTPLIPFPKGAYR